MVENTPHSYQYKPQVEKKKQGYKDAVMRLTLCVTSLKRVMQNTDR